MRDFLKNLSLNTLGFAVIVVGLIVLLVAMPPRSICDAELENFAKGLAGLYFPKGNVPPSLKSDRENCELRQSPGACVGLFSGLTQFLNVSGQVSEQCYAKLGEFPAFKQVIIKALDLMVTLAWGPNAPPAAPALKNGWLNSSDVYLYCRLLNRTTLVYGDKRWEAYREKFFTELPGAKGLSRQDVWEKSLLSTNCNSL